MTTHPRLEPAPTALVLDGEQQLGRFDGPIARTNLLDARYRGWPRALRRWRLKEWQAFQIASPTLFVNLALFDAKLVSLVQVKIFDRARGVKHLHERTLRPGAFAVADQLLDSRTAYADRRGSLGFTNRLTEGRIELEVDVPARGTAPRIAGRMTVRCDRGAPQAVSLPFEGAGGMYSHKGMFPVEGELRVGETLHRFTAADTLALMDDHKGYYPYVMRWDWVTSAVHVGGRALGFNLTRNQCRDPGRYNENCAWDGDQIGLLPAVSFVRERVGQPGERWLVRDADGRVDLVFTPTVAGDVRLNALVVESRYRGPFGAFTGRLVPDGLDPIDVDGWFGMGEDFYLRC